MTVRWALSTLQLLLNPVVKSIKNRRVGIAHPTIAQLVFKDLFQPHSVLLVSDIYDIIQIEE